MIKEERVAEMYIRIKKWERGEKRGRCIWIGKDNECGKRELKCILLRLNTETEKKTEIAFFQTIFCQSLFFNHNCLFEI